MSRDTFTTTPAEAPLAGRTARSGALARLAAFARTERGIVTIALGLVALHIADDNFIQPEPGTSPGDHLVSGLVPIAILAAVAAVYGRVRAGVRATLAMTAGGLGLAFGIPSAYWLREGEASGDHYTTGLLSVAAGAVLLVTGLVVLWRARRTYGSRRRTYLHRAVTVVVSLVLALVVFMLFVFPVGYAYLYTHTGRGVVEPDLRVPFERVTATTSDGLDLTGSYVPSQNRAAVILFPGATRSAEARMLIRHGYGVLLLNPRGQGTSEGDTVRWAGDRDLAAGAEYLQTRPDVDPDRIGAYGFSVGGEILIVAAAQSPDLKAIVSEGAGFPAGEADLEGANRLLEPSIAMLGLATAVFSNERPPPPIVDRIGEIAPRSVFLVWADPGQGGENVRQPKYFAAAGEPKEIWKVPGAEHTGGLAAQPDEYERRVVGFFNEALLGG
jgi:pimeloyl-ACP methyl ester carboxylesterase